jgi:hypothetical protein
LAKEGPHEKELIISQCLIHYGVNRWKTGAPVIPLTGMPAENIESNSGVRDLMFISGDSESQPNKRPRRKTKKLGTRKAKAKAKAKSKAKAKAKAKAKPKTKQKRK